jgi:single-stranded-DNA-specific exonuclease
MAAGLSLPRDAFPAFRDAFVQVARALLDETLLTEELRSDGGLRADDLRAGVALALRDGGYWGQGYPEPLFDGEFEVLGFRVLKERHLKLELGLDGHRCNAIQFNGWDGEEPPPRIHIAYRLTPDDYRGGDAVQLVVVHRERAAQAAG